MFESLVDEDQNLEITNEVISEFKNMWNTLGLTYTNPISKIFESIANIYLEVWIISKTDLYFIPIVYLQDLKDAIESDPDNKLKDMFEAAKKVFILYPSILWMLFGKTFRVPSNKFIDKELQILLNECKLYDQCN